MSDVALALRQVRYENKSFWRNPAAAFFTFAFPLLFLFIFNTVFGSDEIRLFGHETSVSTFYVPAIAAFSVITACFTNIAMGISFARDEGVLKRKLGTPLPKWAFIAGRVVHATILEIVLFAIVAVVGALVYDVDVSTSSLPLFVPVLIIGALAFAALGFAVTTIVPNAEAAPAVINGIILPLLFISDVFFVQGSTPDWLTRIADLFPVRHYVQAMTNAFNPFDPVIRWGDLAWVAAWGLVGAVIALRFFRWEARR
jgi:ABC-2 type transport system permease protein